MRAVIFDLFGTLTDPGNERRRAGFTCELAACLGVPPSALVRELLATLEDRLSGSTGDTRSTLARIVDGIRGEGVDQATLALASRLRLAHAVALHEPRAESIDVLAELRRRAFLVGVLSDCTAETAQLWDALPFADLVDGRVLSCEEGTRKPAPPMYWRICEELAVEPAECWYVGDGGSGELHGAAQVGMRAVLLADRRRLSGFRLGPEPIWDGEAIDELAGVVRLVGRP